MAEAVDFPGSNKVFGPPPGSENCGSLHTFVNGHAIVSAWRPTPEELEEINRTGMIFTSSLSGLTLFPLYVGSESEVRRVVADCGPVWQRSPCFNKGCDRAGTHFPTICFGPGPYRLEVPQLACQNCQLFFDPKAFFGPQAREAMSAMIMSAGAEQPDFDDLRVEWRSKDDPVYVELAGGGQARLWF